MRVKLLTADAGMQFELGSADLAEKFLNASEKKLDSLLVPAAGKTEMKKVVWKLHDSASKSTSMDCSSSFGLQQHQQQ
jgi:hypothetical protein